MAPDTIPLLQAAGATVALVVGAVVRAWRAARAEEIKEAKREALASRLSPVLPASSSTPVADCARHSAGHSDALAQVQRHVARVNESIETITAAQVASASDLRLIIDRLDRLERWLSPSGEGSNPNLGRKR